MTKSQHKVFANQEENRHFRLKPKNYMTPDASS
jgi:YHS domain-containing protein